MNEYGLIAKKRDWIPNSFYALFAYDGLFPNWGTKQPFRWLLHSWDLGGKIDIKENAK